MLANLSTVHSRQTPKALWVLHQSLHLKWHTVTEDRTRKIFYIWSGIQMPGPLARSSGERWSPSWCPCDLSGEEILKILAAVHSKKGWWAWGWVSRWGGGTWCRCRAGCRWGRCRATAHRRTGLTWRTRLEELVQRGLAAIENAIWKFDLIFRKLRNFLKLEPLWGAIFWPKVYIVNWLVCPK